MAWYRAEAGRHKHLKIKRLARELSVPRVHAAGLHDVLCAIVTEAGRLDGSLEGITAADLAAEADWDGDADALHRAFMSAGLIDQRDPGGFFVHGYEERTKSARDLDRIRNQDRKRQNKKRKRDKKAEALSRDNDELGHVTSRDVSRPTYERTNVRNKQDAYSGAEVEVEVEATATAERARQARAPGVGHQREQRNRLALVVLLDRLGRESPEDVAHAERIGGLVLAQAATKRADVTEQQIADYVADLKHIDPAALDVAFVRSRRECRYMPAISEILGYVREEEHRLSKQKKLTGLAQIVPSLCPPKLSMRTENNSAAPTSGQKRITNTAGAGLVRRARKRRRRTERRQRSFRFPPSRKPSPRTQMRFELSGEVKNERLQTQN